MLRDRSAPVDLFALVPALQLRFEPELAELDQLLGDDQVFQQIKADLSRRYPHTTETGRPSTPVEVILRLLVVQHLYAWSYAQTEHFVGDSLVLRQFCRLGLDPVPHHTTLMRWSNLLQPETMHRLLDRVTELAQSLKVTRGRKLRIDSTVVATAIHYPTDSTLLFDGVRVLSRLVQRATLALTGRRRRVGVQRMRAAKQLVRRIEATAAAHATARDRAERPPLYRRLLGMAAASLDQAERVRQTLATRAEATLQPLHLALGQMADLVQQVIAQTQRRVVDGESVPASAKLVSLFEPHTAIVRRGKAHLPAEFGRKIMFDEVEGGLVTRYAVLAGNPPDAPELPQPRASSGVFWPGAHGAHRRPCVLHPRQRTTRTRPPYPLSRFAAPGTTHAQTAGGTSQRRLPPRLPLAGRYRGSHQRSQTPIRLGSLPLPRRSGYGTLGRLGATGPQPPPD